MQTELRVTNYEATFNAIDDILWKEAGCGSELDYIEQTSWILFLKYLDDLEQEREDEAILRGETYRYVIDEQYRWGEWAAPKTANGEIDMDKAMTGDDLTEFVGNQLFPYLRRFKDTATSPRTLEYKIGEIFGELHNRISSGYNLRDILNKIDQLHFASAADKHEMSLLYESKIQRMGNAGRNGGEYYTPRPLIRTIVRVVNPNVGDTVYDGACGSAGFLCEAFNYMQQKAQTTEDMRTLQDGTFFGKEKKSLAYIIGTMNMIFHGVTAPDILHTNTLSENLAAVQRRDQYACVLANPPFGGKERAEVQQNFPIHTSETAYLFLQHFIKHLQAGGRAGIVIKNTFLSNTDNASIALRRQLLTDCCLHTVLDLPSGVFTGAGVKTVVLFFEKGRPTDNVWFYQLNLDRNLGKTNPLTEEDLADFIALQATKADSPNSWTVPISSLDADTLDLSVKNPNKNEEVVLRSPSEIIAEMQSLNSQTAQILGQLFVTQKLFQSELQNAMTPKEGWEVKRIKDICEKASSNVTQQSLKDNIGVYPIYGASGFIKNVNFYHQDKEYIGIVKDGSGIGRTMLLPAFSSVIGTIQYILPKKPNKIRFIYYALESLDLAKYKNGAAIPHIYFRDYGESIIAVPPISEQEHIVSSLDSLSEKVKELEAAYNKTIADCEELKQSLLRKAFNGEL